MGACIINPDEFSEIETHCIALYSLNNNFTNFDSFGVEHKKSFIDTSTVVANIFRIQACDLIMCGYFCIAFIGFMLPCKT